MDADLIRFRVLLFSVLRERVGQGALEVALRPPVTGAALLDRLAMERPSLAPYRSSIRLAVNHTYVTEEVMLEADDEVALITPTSGG